MRYCLFLIVFISAAVFASPEKFALIIGNNTGLSEDPPLKYAAADAQKVYKVLTDIGKINSDRAYLMLNKSVSEIRGIFRETLGRTKEISLSGGDSYVMIYYSGHGSREALHIRGERLLISDVKEYFSEMKAKVKLLVADACYSGSLISEKGGTVSGPTEVKFFDNMEVEGSAVITSCSPGELSHESGDLKGSLFTHYFVSALRGAADFNGDKKVSLWESYSFARQHTARKGMNVKNFSQTPLYEFRIKGRNDLTVTDLNTSKSLLMFHDLQED
ncbi:MAG: caspase domain-containing protein, partial [Fibrobacterota bacterium]